MSSRKRGRRAPAKKSRARVIAPPFVQIAAARVVVDGNSITSLFALDETGGAWQYDFDHSMWYALATKRVPVYTSDEEM